MNTSDYEIFKISEYSQKTHNGKEYLLNKSPYLDIVLHDSCNARCKFCIGDLIDKKLMLDKVKAKESIIQAKEVFGVKEVLLLGGEPTLSKELFDYINMCKEIEFDKICMTTNAIRMSKDKHFANQVLASGITHLNISYMSFNKDEQRYITGQSHYISEDDLAHFYTMRQCEIRINNNVFKGNNDSHEKIINFYNRIKQHASSVKFSPLMLTDNFSVVNEVNEFVRSNILNQETYDMIFRSVENSFPTAPIVKNNLTFGFVPYSMIMLDKPIILNWNQHGKMMQKVIEENKINNIKLLSNGKLSLSWNRNDKTMYLN